MSDLMDRTIRLETRMSNDNSPKNVKIQNYGAHYIFGLTLVGDRPMMRLCVSYEQTSFPVEVFYTWKLIHTLVEFKSNVVGTKVKNNTMSKCVLPN